MIDNDTQSSTGESNGDSDSDYAADDGGGRDLARRALLKGAGTATAAATGIAAFSGNAAALSCGDYKDAWSGYPHLNYGRLNGIRSGLNYRFENVNSGNVLDTEGTDAVDGASALQWSWEGVDWQVWRADHVGGGKYRLTNKHTQKVLDVEGGEGATGDGEDVHQWEWLDNENQKWYIDMVSGNGEHRLKAAHSDKVADVDSASTSDGANVHQWGWHGGDNQRWYPSLAHNDGTLFIFTHGWLEEIGGTAEDQAYTAEDALSNEGVNVPVIGNKYDSRTLDWWDAKDEAKYAGEVFGDWLNGFIARNPDVTVRVMGHSLGAMMTLSALNRLADYGKSIATLDLVGGAVDHDSIGGTWSHGVENAVGELHNYHSYNDGVLDVIYEVGEWDDALGYSGAEGSTPGNYYDHDVSDVVGSHCEYFKRSGCIDRVVANW
jgi:pimeloyl-ACP methyl ester carboxylesterase